MKTQTTTNHDFESTYAMLVRSEEKERNVSETLVYGLMILSAVVSIWQVALQPIVVPTTLVRSASVAQVDAVRPAA